MWPFPLRLGFIALLGIAVLNGVVLVFQSAPRPRCARGAHPLFTPSADCRHGSANQLKLIALSPVIVPELQDCRACPSALNGQFHGV